MDETDQRLLAALRDDARASLSDLAMALGLSRATVRSRMEKLTTSGEIQGYTVVTRHDVVQSPVRGLMMLAIQGQGAERIRRHLFRWPAVRAVHSTNGKWDLLVELGTDTLEALDKVLFEIRRLDGIQSSETSLLLSTQRPTRSR